MGKTGEPQLGLTDLLGGDGESVEDICGFCGRPGADKIPHPVRWPGEMSAGTELVHSDCEAAECGRAHAELSTPQRESFLRDVLRFM